MPDAWLGGLLGRPAYHLNADADPVFVVAGPAFIDAKVETSEIARLAALARAGYHLVDTNVQLERPPGGLSVPAADITIRSAVPADRIPVERVAASAFRFDRFHADPRIPGEVAARIKAAWAGNFFSGSRGDRMLVAAMDNSIVGFLQILDRPDRSVIDLIAVAREAQQRGVASAMIGHAIAGGPIVPWRVGTQVANIASLRLYERLGFRAVSSQYVFHRHVD